MARIDETDVRRAFEVWSEVDRRTIDVAVQEAVAQEGWEASETVDYVFAKLMGKLDLTTAASAYLILNGPKLLEGQDAETSRYDIPTAIFFGLLVGLTARRFADERPGT